MKRVRGREERREGRKHTILIKHTRLPSPAPTEINISNDTLIPEMIPNIAIGVREISRSFTPGTWIRGSAREISRYIISQELPHPNPRSSKFERNDGAEVRVEGGTKCVIASSDATAFVLVGTVDAGFAEHFSGFLALDIHGAARGGVERHLVVGSAYNVHGFHYVDFAVLRPVCGIG